MTEHLPILEDTAAQRASEQARLRKEKREARIKAGASSRLNKITGVAGGVPRGETKLSTGTGTKPITAISSTIASEIAEPGNAPDPAEDDVSSTPFPSSTRNTAIAGPTDAQLRQMMLGLDAPPARYHDTNKTLPTSPMAPSSTENDPLLTMMRQMMQRGENDGAAGAGNPLGGSRVENPLAVLQSLLSGQQPSPGGASTGASFQQISESSVVNVWRIMHTFAVIALSIYFAWTTPFLGTAAQRKDHLEDPHPAFYHAEQHFFYSLATVETVLLTTRFLLERYSPGGRFDVRGSSMMWTIAGILPKPFSGYLETGLRYKAILDTILTDLLLVVFVLGVCAWARGKSL